MKIRAEMSIWPEKSIESQSPNGFYEMINKQ
jgi:hypothetical protein